MRMREIRNFVKVSGTKAFVDYIMAHLEISDRYIFCNESALKSNEKDDGFHKFKDVEIRRSRT